MGNLIINGVHGSAEPKYTCNPTGFKFTGQYTSNDVTYDLYFSEERSQVRVVFGEESYEQVGGPFGKIGKYDGLPLQLAQFAADFHHLGLIKESK